MNNLRLFVIRWEKHENFSSETSFRFEITFKQVFPEILAFTELTEKKYYKIFEKFIIKAAIEKNKQRKVTVKNQRIDQE